MTWLDDADLLLESWSVRGAKRYSGLLWINGKCTNEWKETNKHSELNPDKQSIETASGRTYRLGKPSEEFAPLVEAWFKKELGEGA